MTPYGGRENPYQYLTKLALKEAGCEVHCFGKQHILPFRSILRSGVDVVHMDWSHSFYCSNNKLLDAYKKRQFLWELERLDIPLVWTVHNLARHNESSPCRDEYLDHLIGKASALVSLSDVGRKMIGEAFSVPDSTSIISIPHGHYASYYSNNVSLDDARKSLSIPRDKTVGLFMGRIQPYKGLEPLIDAYLQCDELSEHQVFIAGMPISVDYANRLKVQAKNSNRIHFHFGFVPNERMQFYFNAADYAVYPFKKVFNSGSVILALSFGLPVVIPDHPVLCEVVPQFARSSFTSVSDIRRAIVNVEVSRRIRTEIIDYIKLQNSWRLVGKSLLELYQKLQARG